MSPPSPTRWKTEYPSRRFTAFSPPCVIMPSRGVNAGGGSTVSPISEVSTSLQSHPSSFTLQVTEAASGRGGGDRNTTQAPPSPRLRLSAGVLPCSSSAGTGSDGHASSMNDTLLGYRATLWMGLRLPVLTKTKPQAHPWGYPKTCSHGAPDLLWPGRPSLNPVVNNNA
jgi:hypothetical protein